MRNYWLRIALGAIAIFTVGMVARGLINQVHSRIHGVVEGSGPLSIPLAFIPFRLGGDKLGTLQRVTLNREAPNHVSSVELEIKLSDSVLARGLEGCRLAANLDNRSDSHRGINIQRGPFADGNFWCATEDSADAALVEYGQAEFSPGDVTVPLLLPQSLVDELQNIDFGADSTPPVDEAQVESIVEAASAHAESIEVVSERMADSLRTEGRRRADSARRVFRQMADSSRSR